MGMRVHFAIHHAKKQCAVFAGGDEHGVIPLPKGWEALVPRVLLPNEADFDRWIRLDLHERLVRLTPPGYRAIKGIK